MEQGIAFAVVGGFAYWNLKNQLIKSVEGPDPQGFNTYTPSVAENYESIYQGSNSGQNVARGMDYTPQLRKKVEYMIAESKFESRHPTLDPLRFKNEDTIGNQLDPSVPDPQNWTVPHEMCQ